MDNKTQYAAFCEKNYVPIFSKPFWMDLVCGPENWDVWLYESGGNVIAAMPYYMEKRGQYRYITKAPFTQTNGIQFGLSKDAKPVAVAELQEKIINAACEYLQSLDIDVYEQQYHFSFTNWSPFYWNNYTTMLRYTYVIQDASSPERIMEGLSANYRKNVRKGQRTTRVCDDITPEQFYACHDEIYKKQGIPSPLSKELWRNMYAACKAGGCGKLLCARDEDNNIHSIMYLIWDEKAMYPLLGGYMPEFSSSQSYPALTYYSICMAGERGLKYDFEGSMIQRIAHSFRQFGGVPMPYYRIRKVFNPEIVRIEAEAYIERLKNEKDK